MRSKSRASKFCYLKPNFQFANGAVKKFVRYLLVFSCTPLMLGALANASPPPPQELAQVVSATSINRPNLKIGSKGNAVNELQAALKLLGFYQGDVNGEYDNATASAVSQFRQAAGLSAANIVDTSVWQKLFPRVNATSATVVPSPPSLPAPVTRSTQFPIPTQTQTPNVMGVVASAPEPRPANPSPQVTQRSNTSTSPAAKPKPKPQPAKKNPPKKTSTSNRRSNSSSQQRTTRRQSSSFPNFAKKPNIQYTNEGEPILRVGMRGEEVYFLQGRLRRLGFLKNQPDGDFGVQTESAVKALQKRFGLDADGVVGGATWDVLRK